MSFPFDRPRRLRATPAIRRMVRETKLTPDDLIYPLFVVEGQGVKEPIDSLAGQFHLSPDMAAQEAETAWKAGVPAVILFGLAEPQGPPGLRSLGRGRGGPAGGPGRQGGRAPDVRHLRHLPVRIHRPRPLRAPVRGDRGQRRGPAPAHPEPPCPRPRPEPTWWPPRT